MGPLFFVVFIAFLTVGCATTPKTTNPQTPADRLTYFDTASTQAPASSSPPLILFTSNSVASLSEFTKIMTFAGRVIVIEVHPQPSWRDQMNDHLHQQVAKVTALLKDLHVSQHHLIMEGWGCALGFLYSKSNSQKIKSFTFLENSCEPFTGTEEDNQAALQRWQHFGAAPEFYLARELSQAFEFIKLSQQPKLLIASQVREEKSFSLAKTLHRGRAVTFQASTSEREDKKTMAQTLTNWFLRFQP